MAHKETKERKAWDAVSALFDIYADTGMPEEVADNVFILWPALTEKLSTLLKRPAKVLDFGCGTGGLCNRLYLEGYDVTGIDISKAMIDIARKHSSTAIAYTVGNSGALKTLGCRFDAVISMMVFQFIEDIEVHLPLFRDLLSENGIMSIAVFNPAFVDRCAYGVQLHDIPSLFGQMVGK